MAIWRIAGSAATGNLGDWDGVTARYDDNDDDDDDDVMCITVTGAAVLGGPLYAVGGHDGWSYLSSVERYDPETEVWTHVASMSSPRSTLGVAVVDNRSVELAVHSFSLLQTLISE